MPTNTDPTSGTSIEKKLDTIIEHLEKIDARDRLRMWGGFIRGCIAIVPIAFLVWSSWYFVQHGADLMKQITDIAASSAAKYTQTSGQGMVDELMKKYSFPGATK